MLLLIKIVYVGCQAASSDDLYDDYEEIPDSSPADTGAQATTISNSIFGEDDDDERLQLEQNIIKDQLEVMSNTFRKNINKIKMKHKRIEMVFLVDSSSSVGKENFLNEISFVKRLLSDFNVSFNYTRVALITFSSRSKIVSEKNYFSLKSLMKLKIIFGNP